MTPCAPETRERPVPAAVLVILGRYQDEHPSEPARRIVGEVLDRWHVAMGGGPEVLLRRPLRRRPRAI